MNKYYVYAYLDPFKPVDNGLFEYTPFYIGKGCGQRYRAHINTAKKENTKHTHLIAKIRKILNQGVEPIIVKIKTNLLEQEAFILEIEFIAKIKTLFGNVLTNKTPGGEGQSMLGKTHSELTKAKMRDSHLKLNRTLSEEHKQKLRQSLTDKNSGINNKATGTIFVKNTELNECKRIQPNELSEYLLNGWVKGAFFNRTTEGINRIKEAVKKRQIMGDKNPAFGKIWINHPVLKLKKRILPSLAEPFYNEGWVKGM